MGGSFIEKGPPEQLVLGAKLKCEYGSSPSYLMVDPDRGETINGLPAACVTDSLPAVCVTGSEINANILPFGNCLNGSPCTYLIGLTEEWENPEPQNKYVNGKEIITTDSFLICEKQGGLFITPEDSGQDGVFAEQMLFLMEMSAKYPGLFEALVDPNSSIYLTDGMQEMALDFLQDAIERFGGESGTLEIPFLYQTGNLVSPFLLAAVGHLSVVDVSDAVAFKEGLENEITKSGLENGADAEYFNMEMWEVLNKNSADYAEEVKAGGVYKWLEEHKALLAFLDQTVTSFAYATVIWASSTSYSMRQGNNSGIDQDKRDAEIGSKNRAAGEGAGGAESPKRPSWRQSELDVQKSYSNYEPQKSFKNGQEVPYGTKGSTRPELYKSGHSIEVKNYKIETSSGQSNLVNNVSKQVQDRVANLPNGTKQTVVVDVRGQNVSNDILKSIRSGIWDKSGVKVEVIFKR